MTGTMTARQMSVLLSTIKTLHSNALFMLYELLVSLFSLICTALATLDEEHLVGEEGCSDSRKMPISLTQ